MSKFFRIPWATGGDTTAIPDEDQIDGSVSYEQGFGSDYEIDKTVDPINAKDVPREESNALYKDITENLNEWQTFGIYPFITPAQNDAVPFPYAKNAKVLWVDGEIYESLITSNTGDPDANPSDWVIASDFTDMPRGQSFNREIKNESTDFEFAVGAGRYINNSQTVSVAASVLTIPSSSIVSVFIDSSTNLIGFTSGTVGPSQLIIWRIETDVSGIIDVEDLRVSPSTSINNPPLGKAYVSGLELQNNITDSANDIDIFPGSIMDWDNVAFIDFPNQITKQIDAVWAPDNPIMETGGLPAGVPLVADSSYRVFVISNGSTVYSGFDTSDTAANLLTAAGVGFVYYRRVGDVQTNGASNIYNWVGTGNNREYFYLEAVEYFSGNVVDISNISTTPIPNVPCPANRKLRTSIYGAMIEVGSFGASCSFKLNHPDQDTGPFGVQTADITFRSFLDIGASQFLGETISQVVCPVSSTNSQVLYWAGDGSGTNSASSALYAVSVIDDLEVA